MLTKSTMFIFSDAPFMWFRCVVDGSGSDCTAAYTGKLLTFQSFTISNAVSRVLSFTLKVDLLSIAFPNAKQRISEDETAFSLFFARTDLKVASRSSWVSKKENLKKFYIFVSFRSFIRKSKHLGLGFFLTYLSLIPEFSPKLENIISFTSSLSALNLFISLSFSADESNFLFSPFIIDAMSLSTCVYDSSCKPWSLMAIITEFFYYLYLWKKYLVYL